jgi:uncharacterized protein YPO0396
MSAQLEKGILHQFELFKRDWPQESAELDASLESCVEFFDKLRRLVEDGLPAHEERFFDLFKNQSLQNLAALSTRIKQSKKEILERMELVNASLSLAEFNRGTWLKIEVKERHLPAVREFSNLVRDILSEVWSLERKLMEDRFVILKDLILRLTPKETSEKAWYDQVLDVRRHVEFEGVEYSRLYEKSSNPQADEPKHQIEEVYQSGSGKSGGQRQKLTTTCLAAALRYQLGGSEHTLPTYAAVVMDEAFDKADHEFTELAMNIFANFGFQMILATPVKSVMTLEPFVGGVGLVNIQDRHRSSVVNLEYDEDKSKIRWPEA